MICLDSNIFIYPFVNKENNAKVELHKKLFVKIANREILAATSILTWDEFTYTIKKHLGRDNAVSEGKKFLSFPNLIFLKVDDKVIFLAQDLLTKYNLNPRNAIHTATALTNNINEILSDDSDFDQIKEIKRIKLENFK